VITAMKVFKMQNKVLRILRMTRKLVFRLRVPAHVCHSITNFRRQPVDMLRI
jgi:hypothetical protein